MYLFFRQRGDVGEIFHMIILSLNYINKIKRKKDEERETDKWFHNFQISQKGKKKAVN